MSTGLYYGVSAMTASEKRLEAITSNIANASTAAYKRHATASTGFLIGRDEKTHLQIGTRVATDFAQGPIERTDNTFDLAFQSGAIPDFFAVEGPQGEIFTRNGSFHLNESGTLQTAEGYMVAWEGPRQNLDPAGSQVSIDKTGTIFQGSDQIGQLKIVSFNAPLSLQQNGQGYYEADPSLARDGLRGEVHQGALERSNVSTVDEMIAMITVQRRFEAASNVLDRIDETYQRLNNPR
jgi:flagellar basal body rod protein FlgG